MIENKKILLIFGLVSKHPYTITMLFILLYSSICVIVVNLKELNKYQKLFFLLVFSFSSSSLVHTTYIWNLNLALLLGFSYYLIFNKLFKQITNNSYLTILFGFLLSAISRSIMVCSFYAFTVFTALFKNQSN
ncbi:MAG: hypothetical protein KatS3mg090_0167 [Patescibacteria group bacterium]|nr:MAG: hypothetical protein KatS3mg090_0167 [Patescibacteria group bacterium]